MRSFSRIFVLLVGISVVFWSNTAAAGLDPTEPDLTVGCFPSDRGLQGDWTLPGPPFRVQGPLKLPADLWMRPRRTCGPTELSLGAQPSIGGSREVYDLSLDVQVARTFSIFGLAQGTHGTGSDWRFSSTPIGIAWMPPWFRFEQIVGIEARALLPTASHSIDRRWGAGLGASATTLHMSWLSSHMWVGVDYERLADASWAISGTALAGLQAYPRPWVSFVGDFRVTASEVSEFVGALGLRFAVPFASIEVGGDVRLDAATSEATPEVYGRMTLHF